MSTDEATRDLDHGAKFPYDAPDSWWRAIPRPASPLAADWAHTAARGVVANLEDRHTIKWGFQEVEENVRQEIIASLAEIIRLAQSRKDQPKI